MNPLWLQILLVATSLAALAAQAQSPTPCTDLARLNLESVETGDS